MRYGIDVSHHQGLIEWEKVKGDGIEFCISKAMYESNRSQDEYFAQNYASCQRVGIDTGVYVYVASRSIQDPLGEAQTVVDIIGKRKMSYGIWIDAEDKALKAVGKDKITEIIKTEAEIYCKAGLMVGIYANRDWYMNVLDKRLFDSFPFWCARYPLGDRGEVVERLSPHEYAAAWQYSSKGKVNGITGNVDRDIDFSVPVKR